MENFSLPWPSIYAATVAAKLGPSTALHGCVSIKEYHHAQTPPDGRRPWRPARWLLQPPHPTAGPTPARRMARHARQEWAVSVLRLEFQLRCRRSLQDQLL